jgi:hypothetical protein
MGTIRQVHTIFYSVKLKREDKLGDVVMDEKIILKRILKK